MKAKTVIDQDILLKLQEILRLELDDDSLQVTAQTSADDVAAWDSLAHIRIITSAEREFNVQFDLDQIDGFNNVGDIVSSIKTFGASA